MAAAASSSEAVLAAVQASLASGGFGLGTAGGKQKASTVPGPPAMPAYLSPAPRDFSGYKLVPGGLACTPIPLAKEVDMSSPSSASSAPGSFLSLSQKLRTNQLVVLKSESRERPGAHALYYVDHKGVWQVDPPTTQAADAPSVDVGAGGSIASSAEGGSHCVYAFDAAQEGDAAEDGEGLSLTAIAPCFLVLTRAGGRLTVFLATPVGADGSAGALNVLFDGSPLSPAPLAPHHATVVAAALTRARDQLVLVLYEFWEESAHGRCGASSATESEEKTIQFEHESDAIRGAGMEAVERVEEASHPGAPAAARASPSEGLPAVAAYSALAASAPKHALHKLTTVQLNLTNVPGFGSDSGPAVGSSSSAPLPRADLVHSFSSVHNHRLARDDMPTKFLGDSNWSAPLACWIELPQAPTHVPATSEGLAAANMPPFFVYVVARVPYLNETESVVYELARRATEAADKAVEHLQPLNYIPRAQGSPGIGGDSKMDTSASAPSPSPPRPPFTSESIVHEGHNLKQYSVDNEDDDEDMDELGLSAPSSMNPTIDASLQLFDPMGNLVARRSFVAQPFLFAQVNEGAHLMRGRQTVVGVKQNEELLLYTVSAAPQPTAAGLSLGAAGSVVPESSDASRIGIVLKPLFSYAGLGYVQSGKQFKKFFMEDGAHQHVLIGEYARHVYVYGRPSKTSTTAPHYLLQMPHEADPDANDARLILGVQTVVVPLPTSMPVPAGANVTDADVASSTSSVQGQPLVYVLTSRSCRQYRLPVVTLPA